MRPLYRSLSAVVETELYLKSRFWIGSAGLGGGGARGSVVAKALCYMPQGRGLSSLNFFQLT
jgi:hypothetical protein